VAAEVLSGHVMVHGPRIHQFEKDFAKWVGAESAVAVSSCTAGLHLAYFHLGIGPGDEVIVPAMTHVATAHAVEFTGATPIFVDAEIRTGNINIDQIEEAITPRTKALSLVHFLGMPVDMDRINKIAKKHDLFVVEDSALAFGAKYKGVHAGLLGDIGLFSMYPVKHITTLEGGLILSKHPEILEKIALQRAFGVDRTHGERKIPGQYDVNLLGFNYRMNELQAAIGSIQVDRLDGFLEKRKENYEIISGKLDEIKQIHQFESSNGNFQSSYYCKSIVLQGGLEKKRTEVIGAMTTRGVGTSIYYPRPVPELTYYREKYGSAVDEFPEAAKIANHSVALPVGPHLRSGDAEYVADAVIEVIKELL
jgi:perosamine synthetase